MFLLTAAGYSHDEKLGTIWHLVLDAMFIENLSDGRWVAELSPVGGPTLGPFGRRSEALAAEQRWLETHWLEAGT
jgi:hypothetical protein